MRRFGFWHRNLSMTKNPNQDFLLRQPRTRFPPGTTHLRLKVSTTFPQPGLISATKTKFDVLTPPDANKCFRRFVFFPFGFPNQNLRSKRILKTSCNQKCPRLPMRWQRFASRKLDLNRLTTRTKRNFYR